MKIPCWSCGEPRDTLEEFCPQCGAGEKPVTEPVISEVAGYPPADVPDGIGAPNKPKAKKVK